MKIPLLTNGNLLVTPDFRRLAAPVAPADAQMEEIGVGPTLNLDAITVELMQLTCTHQGDREPSDAAVAAYIHQRFPLTRREAAQSQFWHYLTVVKCPEYVVWRWRRDGQVPKERYLGTWERNALARLWWVAELTIDRSLPDPYSSTRKVAGSQEFSLWCVDSFLSGNPSTMREMISVAFDGVERMTGDQIRELFKSIVATRATHAVDLLDNGAMRQLVASTATRVLDEE